MPWVRLDDQFTDHPKIAEVGPLASWLYVCGLCYSARMLTDGFIPRGQVRKLADVDDVAPLVTALVISGLWEECDGGYRIHDYHDYNPTAEKVKEQRKVNATRQARFRDKSTKVETVTPDITPPDDDSNGERNGERNGVTNSGSANTPYPYPVLTNTPLPPTESKTNKTRAKRPPVHDEKPTKVTNSQPYLAVTAMCERLGTDPHVLDSESLAKQCKKAKELLDRNFTVDEIVSYTGFLMSQKWRDHPIDMFTIAKDIASWRMNGSLPAAESRALPPTRKLVYEGHQEYPDILGMRPGDEEDDDDNQRRPA